MSIWHVLKSSLTTFLKLYRGIFSIAFVFWLPVIVFFVLLSHTVPELVNSFMEYVPRSLLVWLVSGLSMIGVCGGVSHYILTNAGSGITEFSSVKHSILATLRQSQPLVGVGGVLLIPTACFTHFYHQGILSDYLGLLIFLVLPLFVPAVPIVMMEGSGVLKSLKRCIEIQKYFGINIVFIPIGFLVIISLAKRATKFYITKEHLVNWDITILLLQFLILIGFSIIMAQLTKAAGQIPQRLMKGKKTETFKEVERPTTSDPGEEILLSPDRVAVLSFRALRGFGYPMELAKEAGDMVAWLEARCSPAFLLLTVFLMDLDGKKGFEDLKPKRTEQGELECVCPFLSGRVLSGVLEKILDLQTIRMWGPASPLLMAPILAFAAARHGKAVRLTWLDSQISCSKDSMRIDSESMSTLCWVDVDKLNPLGIEIIPPFGEPGQPLREEISFSVTGINRLEEFANRIER